MGSSTELDPSEKSRTIGTGPALNLCERTAAERGLTLTWRFSRGHLTLAAVPRRRDLANLDAQFESAVRTVLLAGSAPPQTLIFLMNDSGSPRPAYGLAPGAKPWGVSRDNFVALCDVGVDRTERSAGMAGDPVVVWIDDPTCRAADTGLFRSPIKAFLLAHAPVLLDDLRQRRTRRLDRRMMSALAKLRADRQAVYYPPASRSPDPGPRTILFCLYWLDVGGAEAFAIRNIAAAKAEGYRVVVTCDEPGRHRLLAEARRHADAIYLLGDHAGAMRKDATLLAVVRQHKPDILHIHHSWTAYGLLPTLRTLGLVRGVVDTTHILEHRFAGFVGEASLYSEFIDAHHVISRDLSRMLVERLSVDPRRIRLGKLHEMSRHFAPAPDKWASLSPLRVAFVGRFSQQKRPFLFVEMARRLTRRFGLDRFRFQAVGEGVYRNAVERQAARAKLGAAIEFLPGDAPVTDILSSAHVLVIPSDNEGLTLVAFEAIRANCLVISTDVGAQKEIVIDDLLVPAAPACCVRHAVRRLSRLATGHLPIAALLEAQQDKLQANMAEPCGIDTCLTLYRELLTAKEADVSAA